MHFLVDTLAIYVVPLITTVTTYRFLLPSATFVAGSIGGFGWTRVWLRRINNIHIITNPEKSNSHHRQPRKGKVKIKRTPTRQKTLNH
jgi:hypothetical protein